jgi:hypothetical protein
MSMYLLECPVLIHLVTLTEVQIRTYHRGFNPGYKGVAFDSIWLIRDLMEIVFQRWYRNAVDAFFDRHLEYQDNLSALCPRDQLFSTFRMFHFVQSPLSEFLSVVSNTSHFSSLTYPIVITFDPNLGHFQTWTAVYPDSVMQLAKVPQDLLLFSDMCTCLFPASLPDPLVQRPLQGNLFRIRANRTPYIGQQLERLNDLEPDSEEKRADDEIRPARIRKCKQTDLSEISLMNQADITPVNQRHVRRAQESFPWNKSGNTHLYSSLSDIDGAGRGAFMRHQVGVEEFLGWYVDSPSGYPDSDDDDSETIHCLSIPRRRCESVP